MPKSTDEAIQDLKKMGYKVKRWSANCTDFNTYLVGTGIEDAVLVSEENLVYFVAEVKNAGFPQTGRMC